MLQGWIDLDHPLWWTVEGLLDGLECRELAWRIDAAPREVASISAAGGARVDPTTRNNTRFTFDDAALAARLWERVRPHVPERLLGARAVGLNERFRGYRYGPGQRFKPHYDGSFERDARERSLLTLLVYLDEGCEGGETRFLDLRATVTPRTGLALFFQHRVLHEGCEVRDGVKHVLRTDVMYRADAEG